jgi:enoyl-[acyl-carrier protein] reductase II
MLCTRICNLLGIEYPIFQGAMAWMSPASLAAAVSEGGGLGIIGTGISPAAWLLEQILELKKKTNKPFGVNVLLLSPHIEEIMKVIVQERVPVVTTGAGDPGKYIDSLKSVGTKIFPVIPSVALARKMEELGVDGLIAEGMEAGGHVGDMTTMALVPQVVDAVKIPVVAAGGIADGRGLIAAIALGASGVQVGTRFIVANECPSPPSYKQAVISASDRDTVVTGTSTGNPVRVIKNRFAREMLDLEKQGASKEIILKFGEKRYAAAVFDGDMENGSVMAGQCVGLVKKHEPAAEIIKNIMREAYKVVEQISMGT